MRYHKSKHFNVGPMPNECVAEPTGTYKPLSYFLNGGIDLTGEELDKSAAVEYDSEEDLAELRAEGAMAVPYGDPRESKFSLIERYQAVGEAMSDASPVDSLKPDKTPTSTTE